ncbi:MAG: hypothetical protein ABJA32_00125, partial [Ginsengibacter sp.]
MPHYNRYIFSKNILFLDNIESEVSAIAAKLKTSILTTIRRKGAIVGISGGIDSSVSAALAVKALGPENVIGVLLPEKDSSEDSKELALLLARQLGIQTIEENITSALDGFGCYRRRDEAVTSLFPEYNPKEYKMKIGINSTAIINNLPPVFSLTIVDKDGQEKSKMLPPKQYLQIVAASNFKQRCRMSMLYYHAERLYFAV